MKKVLAIAPYSYLPYFSGGQKFIALFFEHLGKEVDLTVISVEGNDFSLAKSYRALPLLKRPFSRYLDFSLVSKIVSLIRKEKIDVIIWEHPYYAWLAYMVKKQTAVTTILHSHNIEHQRFKSLSKWWWPVLKVYEEWFFKLADLIFFITPTDKKFALEYWNLPSKKAVDVPYGIEVEEYPQDKPESKNTVRKNHEINEEDAILLFNGALDYKPNLDALVVILDKINPVLLANRSFKYKILVCGKNLPEQLNRLEAYKNKNIIYAGFVSDIDTYFKGADLFLNPVQTGGGIKTKMVEAIGFGTTVVASETGTTGINIKLCGEKIIVIKDDDWHAFGKAVIQYANLKQATPFQYYDYYSYRNIIKKIRNALLRN